MICEQTDFLFPLLADIYYPHITQGAFNEVKKEWIFNRSVACLAEPYIGRNKKVVNTEPFIQYSESLIARSRSDVRVSLDETPHALTNVLIANIRTASGNMVYKETAGPRVGKGTIYEVSTLEPYVGPFGEIEYYILGFRRAENQAVGN
jgi:hypothetical protein